MERSVLDDLENLTQSSSTAPASAAPPPRPSAPSQLGETTANRIVQACELQNTLGRSLCKSCASRVLAKDSKNTATLYCSALYRDIDGGVVITDCTAFQPEEENT